MAFKSKNDILVDELKKVQAELRAKIIHPYYFLYGDENYLIDETLNRIKKLFVDDSELNFKLYTNENFDLEESIKYIMSFPLMNEKKLIVYKDVPFFRQKNKSEYSEKDAESFVDAIKENKEQNIIIIIDHKKNNDDTKYEKYFDSTNIIAKFIKEQGVLLNIYKFDDATLNKYVIKRFNKSNKVIDKVEAAYIVRIVGNNLETLYNECDKVISYVGDKENIERADIDNVIISSVDDNVFDMINFINNNKPEEALKLYGDLISSGEKPNLIIAALSNNYKNLAIVKGYMARSKNKSEIANLMGLAPWQVERLMTASKYTSFETFEEKLHLVTKLNVAVSSGNMDEKLVSEILFLK